MSTLIHLEPLRQRDSKMFCDNFPSELRVHEADCALTYGVRYSIYHIALVALGRERNARQIRTRRCNRWFRENAVFGLRLPVSGKIINISISHKRSSTATSHASIGETRRAVCHKPLSTMVRVSPFASNARLTEILQLPLSLLTAAQNKPMVSV